MLLPAGDAGGYVVRYDTGGEKKKKTCILDVLREVDVITQETFVRRIYENVGNVRLACKQLKIIVDQNADTVKLRLSVEHPVADHPGYHKLLLQLPRCGCVVISGVSALGGRVDLCRPLNPFSTLRVQHVLERVRVFEFSDWPLELTGLPPTVEELRISSEAVFKIVSAPDKNPGGWSVVEVSKLVLSSQTCFDKLQAVLRAIESSNKRGGMHVCVCEVYVGDMWDDYARNVMSLSSCLKQVLKEAIHLHIREIVVECGCVDAVSLQNILSYLAPEKRPSSSSSSSSDNNSLTLTFLFKLGSSSHRVVLRSHGDKSATKAGLAPHRLRLADGFNSKLWSMCAPVSGACTESLTNALLLEGHGRGDLHRALTCPSFMENILLDIWFERNTPGGVRHECTTDLKVSCYPAPHETGTLLYFSTEEAAMYVSSRLSLNESLTVCYIPKMHRDDASRDELGGDKITWNPFMNVFWKSIVEVRRKT